ncbi:MAG: LemA family protein [Actinomycetota bacterium]
MPVVILIVVLVAIVAIVLLVGITLYNRLVAIRNQCDEAWSNVDTELQRRYQLIPNLVSTVKGYAEHERELLTQITQLRERAFLNDGQPASQAQDESRLQAALGQLMVRLENYPELKANTNFLELQRELANTEDRIQASLRFYNGNVRENNNRVQQFPSNIVASIGNFGLRDFFEIDNPDARNPVQVEF